MKVKDLIFDIEVGDNIIVLEWEERISGLTGKPYKDQSYVGNELKVLAVELPFVKVQTRFLITTLDTRKATLMKLSDNFVNAK